MAKVLLSGRGYSRRVRTNDCPRGFPGCPSLKNTCLDSTDKLRPFKTYRVSYLVEIYCKKFYYPKEVELKTSIYRTNVFEAALRAQRGSVKRSENVN